MIAYYIYIIFTFAKMATMYLILIINFVQKYCSIGKQCIYNFAVLIKWVGKFYITWEHDLSLVSDNGFHMASAGESFENREKKASMLMALTPSFL